MNQHEYHKKLETEISTKLHDNFEIWFACQIKKITTDIDKFVKENTLFAVDWKHIGEILTKIRSYIPDDTEYVCSDIEAVKNNVDQCVKVLSECFALWDEYKTKKEGVKV